MPTFDTIDQARSYFEGDRFAAENGMTLDAVGEKWSECSVTLARRHQNANGGVMGGVILTLADFAFAVAANNVHLPTVAQQVSANFLNAAKGTRLIARASCRKDGRSTCVYNVDVHDDAGRDVAQLVLTGFKL